MRTHYIFTLIIALLCASALLQAQEYLNWGFTFGNNRNHRMGDMALDANENVYVVGTITGTVDFNPATDTDNDLTSASNAKGYLAKYSKEGALVWTKLIGGEGLYEVTVGPSGEIIVLGTFINGAIIDGNVGIVNPQSSTATTMFIAYFDPQTGNATQAFAQEGTDNQEPYDLKVKGNDIFVAGSFKGTIDLDFTTGTDTQTVPGGAAKSLFITKYTNNSLMWSHTIATQADDSNIVDLEIDSNGAVYIIGLMRHDADFQNETLTTDPLFAQDQSYLAKYDARGNFQYKRRAKRVNSLSRIIYTSLVITDDDLVTIAATLEGGTDIDGVSSRVQGNELDILALSYLTNGTNVKAKSIGASSDQYAFTHGIDHFGNWIISGQGEGSFSDFDPGPGVANLVFRNGQTDTNVAKYKDNLDFVWAHRFREKSRANDRAQEMILRNGNIYLGGFTKSPSLDIEFGEGETLLSVAAGALENVYVISLNNVGESSVSETLCFGENYQLGDSTFNQLGDYEVVLASASAFGKDSLVNVEIAQIRDEIVLSSTVTDVSVSFTNNGSVTINASDAAMRGFEYSLDNVNFTTNNTFGSLFSGNYTAYVKDQFGCTASTTFTVANPSNLRGTVTVSDVTCNGVNDGIIIYVNQLNMSN